MFKSILLFTATLTITPLMAMEEGDDYVSQEEGQGEPHQASDQKKIPKELWGAILNEHMGIKDNTNAGLVSKEWRENANNDFQWQQRFIKDFPGWEIFEVKEGGDVLLGQNKIGVVKNEPWKNIYRRVYEAWKTLIKKSIKRNVNLNLWAKNISLLPSNIDSLIPKNVKSITLEGNHFTSLPSSMAKLVWLKELNLANTQLAVLPDWLPTLKKLEVLIIIATPVDPVSVIEYLKKAPIDINVLVSLSQLNMMKKLDSYRQIEGLYEEIPHGIKGVFLQRIR